MRRGVFSKLLFLLLIVIGVMGCDSEFKSLDATMKYLENNRKISNSKRLNYEGLDSKSLGAVGNIIDYYDIGHDYVNKAGLVKISTENQGGDVCEKGKIMRNVYLYLDVESIRKSFLNPITGHIRFSVEKVPVYMKNKKFMAKRVCIIETEMFASRRTLADPLKHTGFYYIVYFDEYLFYQSFYDYHSLKEIKNGVPFYLSISEYKTGIKAYIEKYEKEKKGGER